MTKEQLIDDHIKGQVDAEMNDRAKEAYCDMIQDQKMKYGEEKLIDLNEYF